ncbi:MAG: glycoside hydrolase family 55 protein [Oscillospiraceae bacterium]|nr:glycoside hydrolase family 55 protein [Oscillospiraceae bacterium]
MKMKRTKVTLCILLSLTLILQLAVVPNKNALAALAEASVTVSGTAVTSGTLAEIGRSDIIIGGVNNDGLAFRNGGDGHDVVMAQHGPDSRWAVRGGEHTSGCGCGTAGSYDFLQLYVYNSAIKNAGSVWLEITYLNNGGDFNAQYTSSSGDTHAGSPSFPRNNDGSWRTFRVRLDGCNFNTAQGHGNQIRFGGGPVISSIKIIEIEVFGTGVDDFAKQIKRTIGDETNYPTKDYLVSDFNVLDYGANEANSCNRVAFQNAIDAARADGGGVVYAPAGTYAFRTDVGETMSYNSQTYSYRYVLNLPASVQLRGDWIDPDTNGGTVQGTVLAVYSGHNTSNADTYVDTGETESQTGGAMLRNVSDRFIQMESGTGVTSLSIWHPQQSISSGTAIPYPWTLFQREGNSATIEHVTLVNSYNGFHSAPSEMHYVLNSKITALSAGIRVHTCTDIGRIEGVNIGDYWSNSGLADTPDSTSVVNYTKTNATGFEMHRSDWEYVANLKVTGYKIGMWVGREYALVDGVRVPAGETPNAQFYGLNMQNCQKAIHIDGVNSYGLLISGSVFGGDESAYFGKDFGRGHWGGSYQEDSTAVQFNGCDFIGPLVTEASMGSKAVISFENCSFSNYGSTAVTVAGNNNLLIAQSRFNSGGNHVSKQGGSAVKSINSGSNGVLAVDPGGNTSNVTQTKSDAYTFEPMPKGVKIDIGKHPKAWADNLLRVDLTRATGNNNIAPSVDVSSELQNALDAMGNAGGGIVHLPGGRYLVNNPITVPAGVELRGTWDVQHHTNGGGTAIFTQYGVSASGNGASLIQLKEGAGLRGLNIVQTNAVSESDFENYNAPFLVQGQGAGVYAVNLTIPTGYRGIDFFTYKTDGHYIDYFGGSLLKAGVWVGGGAKGGFVRNMQFNTHYPNRRPQGGQGYPIMSGNNQNFSQRNCSALKFMDVQDQTIFNNFVYGALYGVHFGKDPNGNNPGHITMIGHGTDGGAYTLFLEDGDAGTKIVAINSELVNTNIAGATERAYVRMGDTPNTTKVHPETELILYNSSFWGSPTTGPIVNNGILRFQQANFCEIHNSDFRSQPSINVNGGRGHVLNSYFANGRPNNQFYLSVASGGTSGELTNNFYTASTGGNPGGALLSNRYSPNDGSKVYGSDVSVIRFELVGVTDGSHTFNDTATPLQVTLTNTGTSALNNVAIAVTGSEFSLGGTTGSASLSPNTSMIFTVLPNVSIVTGTSETVKITINGLLAGSFYVSYVDQGVIEPTAAPTAAPTPSPSGSTPMPPTPDLGECTGSGCSLTQVRAGLCVGKRNNEVRVPSSPAGYYLNLTQECFEDSNGVRLTTAKVENSSKDNGKWKEIKKPRELSKALNKETNLRITVGSDVFTFPKTEERGKTTKKPYVNYSIFLGAGPQATGSGWILTEKKKITPEYSADDIDIAVAPYSGDTGAIKAKADKTKEITGWGPLGKVCIAPVQTNSKQKDTVAKTEYWWKTAASNPGGTIWQPGSKPKKVNATTFLKRMKADLGGKQFKLKPGIHFVNGDSTGTGATPIAAGSWMFTMNTTAKGGKKAPTQPVQITG